MAEKILYSLPEAAALLDIGRKTLLAHVRAGDIRFILIGTGTEKQHRKFARDDLDAFIARRRKQAWQPTNAKGRRTTSTTSPSTVIDFAAARKQRRSAKRMRSKTGSAAKSS